MTNRKWTNLHGVYARSAERADDQQLHQMIRALSAEVDSGNPHVRQALAAFQEEAARRETEKAPQQS